MAVSTDDNNLALYCDFENIALGVRDANYQKFDIAHILEKLLVKGSIVVKKAYCDWERYKNFKTSMHEAAFELIDIPHVRQSGKNSADIRMVVDALDMCYTKSHVDTFVIISGDSDFSPLVSKLRENAKTVIGVGVKNSTSDLLIKNCDEFIYYDDLVRELERKRPSRKRSKKVIIADTSGVGDPDGTVPEGTTEDTTGKSRPKKKKRSSRSKKTTQNSDTDNTVTDLTEAGGSKYQSTTEAAEDPDLDDQSEELVQKGLDLMLETAAILFSERDGDDKLWGSMIKQTLKRRRPGFNERYYGFDSFGKMLKEAEARGFLRLELDDRSGGYIIHNVSL
jgi:uncharacterized protein (TIGR00288 family)